jgi:hypothetical protein
MVGLRYPEAVGVGLFDGEDGRVIDKFIEKSGQAQMFSAASTPS